MVNNIRVKLLDETVTDERSMPLQSLYTYFPVQWCYITIQLIGEFLKDPINLSHLKPWIDSVKCDFDEKIVMSKKSRDRCIIF